jgi:hypothetical protein
MIEASGLFRLERPVDGHEGILIFRRVERVDHIANGRALSDRGRHHEAIASTERLRGARDPKPEWASRHRGSSAHGLGSPSIPE